MVMSNQAQANSDQKKAPASTGSKRPVMEAFFVRDNGEGQKGTWIKIGAAWEHSDQKGMNLNLDCIPAAEKGAFKIVLRAVTESPKAEEQAS